MSLTAQSSSLQERVQNELVWDPQVTSVNIGVTSRDGVVTLSGFVPSFAERAAAEAAALRVQGTRAVANDLTVKLLTDRIDPDIAKDAAEALRLNPLVPKTVKVTVSNAFLTLEGTCDWWYERNEAYAAVRNLAGIRGVDNAIRITPRVSVSDVREKIERALRRSAEVDANRVRISTSGDTVVLSGSVRSHVQRNEAARAAWAAPGVAHVENQLEITP